MRFKFDENLPEAVGTLLRQRGHEAHSVLDENLHGAPDLSIASACRSERRILITLDLDFASIKNYPPQNYHGIVVLRLARQDRDSALGMVDRVLKLLQTEPIDRRLWIVDEFRTRIRDGDGID